ncbi:MAG TPA: hypothetical protein VGM44_09395 [Polyangiaceae bacterium]|jgi:hypothetical protein
MLPSQQPVQHCPFSHLPVPLEQLVPAVTGDEVHAWFTHAPVVHSVVDAQFAQFAPAAPQAVVSVPTEQPLPV